MAFLPKSLQQPFRKNKLVVGAGWRAYFAPYNIALGSAVASTVQGPTIIDLTQGPFDSNFPPFNLADLGWIKNFKLTVGSKIGQVRSGYRGAVRAQYRGQVDESFEFQFNEYGRMQYRLATGSNVINLFSASGLSGGNVGPVSASGNLLNAANVTAYSPGSPVVWNSPQVTAPTLTLATIPQLSQIFVGSYIVADQDYTLGSFGGAIGDPGVNVFQNAVTDVDYLRKNSDFVARVTAINGNVLTLDQPFVGNGSGNPTPNFVNNQFTSFVSPQVRCEAIKGFAAREGGTFIGEWTGLFLNNTVDGAQLVIYYPHVSIAQNKDVAAPWTIENAGTTDETGFQLDAAFNALAFDDPLDGETVVAYKAYYYRVGESAAI